MNQTPDKSNNTKEKKMYKSLMRHTLVAFLIDSFLYEI